MRESFDFEECEASESDTRNSLRPLPSLFAVYLAGVITGMLLAYLTQ